ncbi:MAG: hypothetical protein SAL70_32005 [Scytonema sp. PMC 1070.18]|nr:hypothetical protein [Scytonema sp. PMC 1070.18]
MPYGFTANTLPYGSECDRSTGYAIAFTPIFLNFQAIAIFFCTILQILTLYFYLYVVLKIIIPLAAFSRLNSNIKEKFDFT